MAGPLDKLLHPTDQTRIVEAIKTAERLTSGEIKVHVEARCTTGDPYTRAVQLFERLGLHRTRDRNGVLIYVAARDRRFSLIGDVGINEAVGSAFWADAVERMSIAFRRGAFGEGIVAAIQSVGDRLKERFPPRADDRNELPNDISTSDGEDGPSGTQ
jgi:uncharacterized membrane protein